VLTAQEELEMSPLQVWLRGQGDEMPYLLKDGPLSRSTPVLERLPRLPLPIAEEEMDMADVGILPPVALASILLLSISMAFLFITSCNEGSK
jgi:hypothetical protein